MNRLLLPIALCLFLPTLVCQADTIVFDETPNKHIPPELRNKQNSKSTQPRDSVEIPFEFTRLTLSDTKPQPIQIVHSPQKEGGNPFSLVRNATADTTPNELTIEHFEKICNAINDARRIDDLKQFLSENNFELLESKVKEGNSQQVLLAMIRSQRPENIHIIDSNIEENRATLAVNGKSSFGPMTGVIHLVKNEGVWKIEQENWYAGAKNPLATASIPVPTMIKANAKPHELFPEYRFNRNFLRLTPVPFNKENRAFTFVFLLNKQKADNLNQSDGQLSAEMPTGLAGKPRGHIHLLWTGSKKMMRDQKVFKNQYPVDVTMAQYDDGYAPGEWNLILPKKKPRGVQFSLLWSF